MKKEQNRMKEKAKNPVLETADQAVKNYEQALRTGLKVQEDAWQSWCSLLNQPVIGADWQKCYTSASEAANTAVPVIQKRLQETVELMEKNARVGSELMKKALEAGQTTGIGESQAKWMDFVKTSLDAAQTNVDAVMRINTRTLESFMALVQKNSETLQAKAA
jgi:hypothetical protein